MDLTIALDLEGTIISDEIERIPRPGLYDFLAGCRDLGRVVIYTMVDPNTAREISKELVATSHAPAWFADVECYQCSQGEYKDLNLIPGSDAGNAFLIDDHLAYVHPSQRDRWVQVEFFDPQNPNEELKLALWKLKRKITRGPVPYPGDLDKAVNAMQSEIEDLFLENIELQTEKERLMQIIIEGS